MPMKSTSTRRYSVKILCMNCAKPSYAFALAMHINDINLTKHKSMNVHCTVYGSVSRTKKKMLFHDVPPSNGLII